MGAYSGQVWVPGHGVTATRTSSLVILASRWCRAAQKTPVTWTEPFSCDRGIHAVLYDRVG